MMHVDPNLKRKRQTRINVEPGRSISFEDYNGDACANNNEQPSISRESGLKPVGCSKRQRTAAVKHEQESGEASMRKPEEESSEEETGAEPSDGNDDNSQKSLAKASSAEYATCTI